ncbi:MAG: hypothetical protein JXA42_07135, partial [Anaerolineales bacterium]|nr:hypothetical protein [Anaerolineales bacterium]
KGFWAKVVTEPDNPNSASARLPDPLLYSEMLGAAYEIIKEHDPEDMVVLGGLAGYYIDMQNCETNPMAYLGALYEANAWHYFDVIAIHPYRNSPVDLWAPEDQIPRGVSYSPTSLSCSQTQQTLSLTEEVRQVRELAQVFGEKPIWITELGWDQPWLETRAAERGTSADIVEADYLVRTYVSLLSEPGVEKLFWYSQFNQPMRAIGSFELEPTAQRALALITSLLTGSTPLGQVQGQDDIDNGSSDDVYEYRFEKDNDLIIVTWKARGGDTPRDVVISGLDMESIRRYSLDSPDLSKDAGTPLEIQDGSVIIALSERPVFLIAESNSTWKLFWEGIGEGIADWWEKIKLDTTTKIENWWNDLIASIEDKLNQWVVEIESKFKKAVEDYLKELEKQLCGIAIVPIFSTVVFHYFRRSGKRSRRNH